MLNAAGTTPAIWQKAFVLDVTLRSIAQPTVRGLQTLSGLGMSRSLKGQIEASWRERPGTTMGCGSQCCTETATIASDAAPLNLWWSTISTARAEEILSPTMTSLTSKLYAALAISMSTALRSSISANPKGGSAQRSTDGLGNGMLAGGVERHDYRTVRMGTAALAYPMWTKPRYSPTSRATVRGGQKCATRAQLSVVTICEKQMAGAGSDTSGVATDMHGALLTWMQDHHANGSIFIGPPGAAKSVLAKAAGNAGGIPTIAFDLGAMKSSLVGESGARLRNSLKVIESISQGRAYFIATCNSIDSVSPELRRRFKSGVFFYDLPSASERAAIWTIYLRKFKLANQPLPPDDGWTGAEIEQAADLAWRLKLSLKDAANYIVPVSKSDAQRIKSLRQQADGRFISASYPGVYQVAKEAQTGRRMEL